MIAIRAAVMAAGVMALSAVAAARSELHKVDTVQAGGGLRVTIHGKELKNPKVLRVVGRSSYIVEFKGHLVGKPGKRSFKSSNETNFVQWGWYMSEPPTVRVHVKLKDTTVNPKLVKFDGNWVIQVSGEAPNGKPLGADAQAMKLAEELLNSSSVGIPTPKPVVKPREEATLPAEAKAEEVKKPVQDADKDAFKAAEELLKAEAAVGAKAVKKAGAQPPATEVEVEEVRTEVAVQDADRDAFKAAQDLLKAESNVGTKFIKRLEAQKAAPAAAHVKVHQVRAEDRMVTLDFIGTDVLQILKALSLESGVNIISAPDVSPNDAPLMISATLNKVRLEDALSFITAMGTLRYAKVRDTFVVAKADSFASFMRQLMNRQGMTYETAVVPLRSGEADRIRDAVLAALPQDGDGGYYEVIVQSQEPLVAAAPDANSGSNGKAADEEEGSESQPQQFVSKAKARYLMVIGDAKRVKQVVAKVNELDQAITDTFSVSKAADVTTVALPVQSGDIARIRTMLGRMIEASPRADEFTLSESALSELEEGDESTQVLLMIGPKSEVSALKEYAISLDESLCELVGIAFTRSASGLQKRYEVVELEYIEPMIAEFDLKGRIRGLHVTLLPDPVTPGITGEDQGQKTDAPGSADEEGGTVVKADMNRAIGREPMKLLLRGTDQQIEQAKAYLMLVDVAPKQIALELRVMELTKEDAVKIGLDWSLITGGRLQKLGSSQDGGSAATAGHVSGTFGENDTFSFVGLLDDLDAGKKVIARPNALVSDGRTTSLFVGDTIRYVESIISNQNGVSVQSAELDVGVTFDIKARVGAKGKIALDLDQRFTLLQSFLSVPGGGSLPQTNERRTAMHVNMTSGETLALGGLILEEDRYRDAGVPFLKDIPIVGLLFSRTETIKERTEIVFFLSALEVDEHGRAVAASPRKTEMETPDPLAEYKKTGGGGL
jgi:type II secretory pathway component GspD/PulD (secretin)